jgi:pimeloyl-ACP methyl ester carboxylesterase
VPIEKSLEMAALLDQKNVHIIKESAHMSLFEQSEACYDAIRNFVSQKIN